MSEWYQYENLFMEVPSSYMEGNERIVQYSNWTYLNKLWSKVSIPEKLKSLQSLEVTHEFSMEEPYCFEEKIYKDASYRFFHKDNCNASSLFLIVKKINDKELTEIANNWEEKEQEMEQKKYQEKVEKEKELSLLRQKQKRQYWLYKEKKEEIIDFFDIFQAYEEKLERYNDGRAQHPKWKEKNEIWFGLASQTKSINDFMYLKSISNYLYTRSDIEHFELLCVKNHKGEWVAMPIAIIKEILNLNLENNEVWKSFIMEGGKEDYRDKIEYV